MLTVREAVDRAKQHVRDIFNEEDPKDILLEEVEFLEDQQKWLITISFVRHELFTRKTNTSISKFMGAPTTNNPVTEQPGERRVFKRVHLDANNGKMLKTVSVETGMAA